MAVSANGVTVSGTVYYSTTPLPDIVVDLSGTTADQAHLYLTTTTNASGTYSFSDVPAGNYRVSGIDSPNYVYCSLCSGRNISVKDEDLFVDIYMVKFITVVSPSSGDIVRARSPQFCWGALPEAVSYDFSLSVLADGTLVDSVENISTTCYTTSQTLQNGVEYLWVVSAEDQNGHEIGTTYIVGYFTVEAGEEPDLSVSRIEVTQAIQCLDNPNCFGQDHQDWCPEGNCDNVVPLVKGKSTWVRAYVRCNSNCDSLASIQGWITSSIAPNKAESSFGAATVEQTDDIENRRADLRRTLNFLLPAGWESDSDGNSDTVLDFTIDVYAKDHAGSVVAGTQKDFPGFRFHRQHALDIRYIQVGYQPPGGERTMPNEDEEAFDDAEQEALLETIFPVSDVNYRSWGPREDINVQTDTLWSNERANLTLDLQRELQTGIPEDQRPDILFGWLPDSVEMFHRNPNGSEDRWFGYSAGRQVPFGIANGSASRTLPHELGHELGLGHAPCDVEGNIDWPYTNCTIQEYGFDVEELALVSQTVTDLMGYYNWAGDLGASWWISPYNYRQAFYSGILNPNQTTSQQNLYSPTQQELASSQDLVVVSGLVHLDDQVEFRPFYHVDTSPVLPPSGSDYCLVFQDSVGESLDQYCFDLLFTDPYTQQSTDVDFFVWTLPYPTGTNVIVLKKGSTSIGQVPVSTNAPVVTITSPTDSQSWNGVQQITWTASDADNDQLTFRILYSHDDGETWVPLASDLTSNSYTVDTKKLSGGSSARLKIVVSDGINTNADEVTALNVSRKEPHVTIISPKNDSWILSDEQLFLWGNAYDLEDGSLSDMALSWSSNQDGNLGTGEELSVSLSQGQHTLTLTATDSDGNTAIATVKILVTFPEDVVPDCILDIVDVQAEASGWSQEIGELYDCDGDGVITIVDIMCIVALWGKTCQ